MILSGLWRRHGWNHAVRNRNVHWAAHSPNSPLMTQWRLAFPGKRQSMATQSVAGLQTPAQLAPPAVARTRPIVGWWMLGTSALVFGIVVVGGLTRLTESGLSMVDWTLLGTRPPNSEAEWLAYFEKYKLFPEYQIHNRGMTVDEFKSIYWFEYAHRMLGRFIGGFVLLPGLYFIARGYVTPAVRNRIGLLAVMVGCQGLLGWYMVQSGLDNRIVDEQKVPRVSQYRLAAHLGSALVIYLTALTTGLSILRPGAVSRAQLAKQVVVSTAGNDPLRWFRRSVHLAAGMVGITALSGAFVAGLDAGLVYNTFPMMADRWIPSDLLSLSPVWQNMFENPTTVQFNHRLLAISTFCVITGLWVASRRIPGMPDPVRYAVNGVLAVASLQVALGITTLVWLVPVPLAAAHQSGSVVLLSAMVWLMHLLKRVPK